MPTDVAEPASYADALAPATDRARYAFVHGDDGIQFIVAVPRGLAMTIELMPEG